MTEKDLKLVFEHTIALRTDFLLLEDVDNFDWDFFWSSFYGGLQDSQLFCESVELSSQTEKTDIYKIVLSDGSEFELFINFLTKSDADGTIMSSVISNLDQQEILADLTMAVKNSEAPVLNINFRDSQGNVKLTGLVGNRSFSVIRGVQKGIIQSITKRTKKWPDVLFFYISKQEERKLEFFKRVFIHMFPTLNMEWVDTTNSVYNLAYFWKTNSL